MARKRAKLEDLLNDLTAKNIYDRIQNLALNMFVWEGLPKGMKPRFIEMQLYYYGRALFFKDQDLGFLCLQANPSGGVNVYGEYTEFYAYGYNYNKPYVIAPLDEEILEGKGAVLIRNNMIMKNTHDYVMQFTNELVETIRSTYVNIKQQKTPRIVTCDDKDILTFKNIIQQLDDNAITIYADKNLNLNSLDVLDITAPYVADKLDDHKHDLWNDVNTFLGINNANTDKRERLVEDEVNANNEMIELNAQFMLEARQQACEEINAMFGLKISVRLRETEQAEEEGEEDEPVHAGAEGDN